MSDETKQEYDHVLSVCMSSLDYLRSRTTVHSELLAIGLATHAIERVRSLKAVNAESPAQRLADESEYKYALKKIIESIDNMSEPNFRMSDEDLQNQIYRIANRALNFPLLRNGTTGLNKMAEGESANEAQVLKSRNNWITRTLTAESRIQDIETDFKRCRADWESVATQTYNDKLRIERLEAALRANQQYWKCNAEFDSEDPTPCLEFAEAARELTNEVLNER